MDPRKHTALNLTLYAAASLGTIVGEVTGAHGLVYVCKPFMMLILSSWFYYNSRRVGDRFTLLVQAGLVFSLVGDIALMFQHVDEFNFLVGLGAFLIAQLCYAIAFLHNILEVGRSRGDLISTCIAVLMVAYGYFFAARLLPMVDESITIPVAIYAVAICLMGATAAFRLGRTYFRSFAMVLAGAVFFILSDSLLATNRFIFPLTHAPWSVMLTYALAQVLIVWGALLHVLDPDEIRRKAALST
ncbi:MAG: lysoplasmalogenase [Flavobacteriales bacterium]|nr:lysoplasmalogenase [Flavobacteriales bacterium]